MKYLSQWQKEAFLFLKMVFFRLKCIAVFNHFWTEMYCSFQIISINEKNKNHCYVGTQHETEKYKKIKADKLGYCLLLLLALALIYHKPILLIVISGNTSKVFPHLVHTHFSLKQTKTITQPSTTHHCPLLKRTVSKRTGSPVSIVV